MPLKIKEVECINPTVILRGDDWILSITCPWQLSKDEVSIITWEGEEIEDQIWELVGHQIVGFINQTHNHPGDPNFDLDGGILLEITADTDLDPWVLRLPGITIVGSKSIVM
jgi:hypothetical protein